MMQRMDCRPWKASALRGADMNLLAIAFPCVCETVAFRCLSKYLLKLVDASDTALHAIPRSSLLA